MKRLPRILLVDGDVLVYRCGFAVEKNTDWGNGLHTWHANIDEATPAVHKIIEELRDDLKADKVIMALTCSDTPNFRKAFYPPYKENRASIRKPLLWKAIREYIVKTYDVRIKPNLEADDIIGIMATMPDTGQERIMVSIDKDFRSIPGRLYHMLEKQMRVISEGAADRAFMTQVLTGDATDHYPGLPGVGPKKAAAILEECDGLSEMWQRILVSYLAKGFTEADALVQARCARILRFSDYDSKLKTPILWKGPE